MIKKMCTIKIDFVHAPQKKGRASDGHQWACEEFSFDTTSLVLTVHHVSWLQRVTAEAVNRKGKKGPETLKRWGGGKKKNNEQVRIRLMSDMKRRSAPSPAVVGKLYPTTRQHLNELLARWCGTSLKVLQPPVTMRYAPTPQTSTRTCIHSLLSLLIPFHD